VSLKRRLPRHVSRDSSIAHLLGRAARASGGRYVVEGEIARGGMGAHRQAVDCDIRREVAASTCSIKPDYGKKDAFLSKRPKSPASSSTPYRADHELGLDDEQRLFFTMKRSRGAA